MSPRSLADCLRVFRSLCPRSFHLVSKPSCRRQENQGPLGLSMSLRAIGDKMVRTSTNPMDPARRKLLSTADALAPDARRMLEAITGHAELSLREVRTSETLSSFLDEKGFRVVRGIAGMATAFRAEFRFGPGRPRVAFLCEMDALPGIGHACGHNIGGVASACAAAALASFGAGRVRKGSVVALGTPAEETGYGKALMVKEGV